MRLIIVLAASLALMAISPAFAMAATGDYDVVSYNNSTLGNAANGTFSRNYVMLDPYIVDQHVSSVYVDNDSSPRNMAEVGWFANTTQSEKKPRFFAAWVINDTYNESLETYPTPGTNHYFWVKYLSGTQWEWRIDGNVVHSGGLAGFTTGKSTASSERDDTRETNYSHFWDLQNRNSVGWYSWTNNAQLQDTDSDYHRNEISNTEHYVQHD